MSLFAVFALADEDLLGSGKWRLQEFEDNPVAEFVVDGQTLHVSSDASVGFYHRKILSARQMRKSRWALSWEWRVLETSPATQLTEAGGDDRPVAVHVWINNPSRAGWFRGGLARLFAVPVPGNMITYSWGGLESKGAAFPNPHIPDTGHIEVLREFDEYGQDWFSETVYFQDDLLQQFPDTDIKSIYVVVSSDTEDSQGFAKAEVRNLRLIKLPDSKEPIQ